MHVILKHFHKNQPKIFVKKSTILKNPKFSTKTQKGRSKTCNAWWMSEKETYQKQRKHKKAEEHVG